MKSFHCNVKCQLAVKITTKCVNYERRTRILRSFYLAKEFGNGSEGGGAGGGAQHDKGGVGLEGGDGGGGDGLGGHVAKVASSGGSDATHMGRQQGAGGVSTLQSEEALESQLHRRIEINNMQEGN